MQGKSTSLTDDVFLLVAFGGKGNIESIMAFHAPRVQAKQAAEARALIAGIEKFQIYRVSRAKGNGVHFERIS